MDVGSLRGLIQALEPLPETRRAGRNLLHPLENVLVLAFCAKLSGAENYEDMALYARTKESFFADILDLSNGTPSEDTFRRVLQVVDPMALQRCLNDWLADLRRAAVGLSDAGPAVVAIDGKTLRRTFRDKANARMLHVVGAYATAAGFCLGQVAVEEKSNEIPAIPKLVDALDVAGCVVTIDAAGCQTETASKIAAKGGDYLLALKGNHPKLHEAVAEAFLEELDKPQGKRRLREMVREEKGHGRRDVTTVQAMAAPAGLPGFDSWTGLASVVVACRESTNLTTGVTTHDVRHYLSSMPPKGKALAAAVRSHWGIENGLHWVLDVVFKEDELRVRDRTAATNIALMNRLAVSLLKNEKGRKSSIRGKVKRCGWDDEFLLKVLSVEPPA